MWKRDTPWAPRCRRGLALDGVVRCAPGVRRMWFLLVFAASRVAASAAMLEVAPGGEVEFTTPVSEELRRVAGKGKQSALAEIRGLVAVPRDFDPARSWPILVVSATADPRLNSSRAFARRYREAALAAGWVIVAADPVPVVIPEINEVRYATVCAALNRLAAAWPGAETWPVAYGGFSGGSKYSGFLAAMSARDGRMPVGIFLGGCNAPTPALGRVQYNAPRAFRDVPVFLSSGDDDPVSTPHDHRQVRLALTNDGFRHVRLETYAGRHVVHAAHLGVALAWFDALRGARRSPAEE